MPRPCPREPTRPCAGMRLSARPVEPKPPSPRSLASNDVDDAELGLHHRHDHQLGDALERLDRERRCAAVPAAHHQRALVVGVDQADQVAEDDAVLVAEPRARQQHRREAGIADVDRQAGRHQLGGAGREHQRRVDAGAQVEAGAARRGVGRQPLGDARIEDPHVDAASCARRASLMARRAPRRAAISATSWRASASLPARGSSRAPRASTSVSALSSWPKVAGPRLATISGTFFFSRLALALASRSPLSAAKPTQNGALRQRARRRRGCRGSRPASKRRHALPCLLLDLLARRRRRRASRRPRRWRRRRRCAAPRPSPRRASRRRS